MGEKHRGYRLKILHGRLGEVAYKLSHIEFVQSCGPRTWQPAINAYRCRGQLEICVDLAGMKRSEIQIDVQPGTLVIRGVRPLPEPDPSRCPCDRIIAMEIDYGPFEREIRLPEEIDAQSVHAEEEHGLIWIVLPFKAAG